MINRKKPPFFLLKKPSRAPKERREGFERMLSGAIMYGLDEGGDGFPPTGSCLRSLRKAFPPRALPQRVPAHAPRPSYRAASRQNDPVIRQHSSGPASFVSGRRSTTAGW